MAKNIINTKSNTLISGTSGNDTLRNGTGYSKKGGNRVTINGDAGNDNIHNAYYSSNVKINGEKGEDYIISYSKEKVTINGGADDDFIGNHSEKSSINGGAGDDYIYNHADDVTIIGGKGNDEIKLYDDGTETLIKYNSGDGNDTIIGFGADSTLQISGGSYSTKKSGDNVIVTVGKGKISLMGAASLSKVNIKSAKSTSTNLTVTDKTKSPVTVGSAIKTINASKRTTAVKITGNSLANTITGGSKNDTIYGGSGNDSILGNAGNDKIYGQAGNDILRGGQGNDTLWGGKGNDSLWGGKGNDSLWGNDGDNVFVYANGDGKDVIYGFEDDDMLKITGSFTGTYNKSKKEVYFKVGTTANAITLKDFGSTSTFNVNGTNYKISGSKLVKK